MDPRRGFRELWGTLAQLRLTPYTYSTSRHTDRFNAAYVRHSQ